MIVIPAPGSPKLQTALENHAVQKIAAILLYLVQQDSVVEQDFFKLVARFLRRPDMREQQKFQMELEAIRAFYRRYADKDGQYSIPLYVDELINALETIYAQSEDILGYQRGAIVELLSSKLICPRCRIGECFDNHIFAHRPSRYQSDQVDVAVLSIVRQQLEGYTCKIKSNALMSPDCTNLTALYSEAMSLGLQPHIGVICFDNSQIIAQRIKRIQITTMPLKAYGIDNIHELQDSPF